MFPDECLRGWDGARGDAPTQLLGRSGVKQGAGCQMLGRGVQGQLRLQGSGRGTPKQAPLPLLTGKAPGWRVSGARGVLLRSPGRVGRGRWAERQWGVLPFPRAAPGGCEDPCEIKRTSGCCQPGAAQLCPYPEDTHVPSALPRPGLFLRAGSTCSDGQTPLRGVAVRCARHAGTRRRSSCHGTFWEGLPRGVGDPLVPLAQRLCVCREQQHTQSWARARVDTWGAGRGPQLCPSPCPQRQTGFCKSCTALPSLAPPQPPPPAFPWGRGAWPAGPWALSGKLVPVSLQSRSSPGAPPREPGWGASPSQGGQARTVLPRSP